MDRLGQVKVVLVTGASVYVLDVYCALARVGAEGSVVVFIT
jgi:hypothetical protein